MTPENDCQESPSSEMARALADYTIWLSNIFPDDTPKASGSDLLAEIGRIQRTAFFGASRLMADLLHRHTEIANMLFEHRMAVLRSAEPAKQMSNTEGLALAELQFAAVQAMQLYCDGSPHPIQTLHKVLPNPGGPVVAPTTHEASLSTGPQGNQL